TCADDPREIMAVQHKRRPLFGVQFHPESFLSIEGPRLLANFLAVH
ncbi:MAG TPA: anthranilate/aminodeoxychorismate synthase component II, partial [Phycisphaerae bacterium]|nr:anthranilate/aminodeoxychorismate synthase component II [Phycisphaerae bacterium]